jgi:hypothetical protein
VGPSSVPDGYNGTLYSLRAAAPGFTGSLSVQELTGQVTVTNAGPVGTYTVTVSSSTACGSPSSTFTLEVIGPPASVTATGGTPQSTAANTPFPAPLQATVTDSAGHPLSNIAVTFTAPVSGASATFSGGGSALTGSSGVAGITPTANGILGTYNVTAIVGAYSATFALTNTPAVAANIVATATTSTSVSVAWAGTAGATYEVVRFAAGGNTTSVGTSVSGSLTDNTPASNTAYLYNVHAVSPAPSPYGIANLATTVIFSDPSLAQGGTVRGVHITELRAAVDAVRTLAALAAGTYTDPTLTPGVSVIRAAHINDLRVALGTARNALFLPAIIYTHAFIFPAVTTISAVDVNELRDGVR